MSKPLKTLPQAAHELLELRHRYGWSPEVDAGFAALSEVLERPVGESKLETMAWRWCTCDVSQDYAFTEDKDRVNRIESFGRKTQRLCDLATAEALLAQRDAKIESLEDMVDGYQSQLTFNRGFIDELAEKIAQLRKYQHQDNDELRKQAKDRDDAKRERDLLKQQVAELQAQVEAMREDAERLDHIQKTGSTIELLPGVTTESWRFRVGGLWCAVANDLRAAIDSAMQQKGGEDADQDR